MGLVPDPSPYAFAFTKDQFARELMSIRNAKCDVRMCGTTKRLGDFFGGLISEKLLLVSEKLSQFNEKMCGNLVVE